MCSHYEAPSPEQLSQAFGVEPYEQGKLDLWPGYIGPFLRRPGNTEAYDEAAPALEVLTGSFGLIPRWSKDNKKIVRHTYNARSETVVEKPSFRNAWRHAQHCIIPAMAIYEPDWRTGKAIATRITRADGESMGIAGLWEHWHDSSTGQTLHSFTMLMVNADDHEFMSNYHRPEDEKRMVVILPCGLYRDWLVAPAEASSEFMRKYPAGRLTGNSWSGFALAALRAGLSCCASSQVKQPTCLHLFGLQSLTSPASGLRAPLATLRAVLVKTVPGGHL